MGIFHSLIILWYNSRVPGCIPVGTGGWGIRGSGYRSGSRGGGAGSDAPGQEDQQNEEDNDRGQAGKSGPGTLRVAGSGFVHGLSL